MNPVEKFQAEFGGSRIQFSWLGLSRIERGKVHDETMEYLGTEKRQAKLVKTLIDTKCPQYQKLTKLRSRARACWTHHTLPYVEDRVRLVRIEHIPGLKDELLEYQAVIHQASVDFYWAWGDIKEQARELLGERLWKDSEYQLPNGPDTFSLMFDWPSLEPPAHLKVIDPLEYEKHAKLLQAKFEESYHLAEQLMLSELKKLFEHLIEKCKPSAEGEGTKKKILSKAVMDNFREFFEHFKAFSLNPSPAIDSLLQEAQSLIGGVTSAELKKDELLKSTLVSGAEQLTEQLSQMLVTPGGRKLILPVASPIQKSSPNDSIPSMAI